MYEKRSGIILRDAWNCQFEDRGCEVLVCITLPQCKTIFGTTFKELALFVYPLNPCTPRWVERKGDVASVTREQYVHHLPLRGAFWAQCQTPRVASPQAGSSYSGIIRVSYYWRNLAGLASATAHPVPLFVDKLPRSLLGAFTLDGLVHLVPDGLTLK